MIKWTLLFGHRNRFLSWGKSTPRGWNFPILILVLSVGVTYMFLAFFQNGAKLREEEGAI